MKSGAVIAVVAFFAAAVMAPTMGEAQESLTVRTPGGNGAPGCEESDTCFVPSTIKVSPGGTVTWENNDTVHHTVTSGTSLDAYRLGEVFDSGLMMGGTIFIHAFEEPGEYPYTCRIHPWMAGVVVVDDEPTTSTSAVAPAPETQEEFERSLLKEETSNPAMVEVWEIAGGPEDVQVEVNDKAAEYVHEIRKSDFLVTRNGIPTDHPIECHVRSYGWDERPMQDDWGSTRQNVTGSVSWSLPVGYHHVLCSDRWEILGSMFHGHLVDVVLSPSTEAKGDLPVPTTPAAPHAKGDVRAGDRLVVIETTSGTFTIELFDDDAPNHAANMRNLADSGYYNGTLFHRIIPGFMVQGGDPNTREGDPSTWGQGGEAYGPNDTVDAEFNDITHAPGIVSAARRGSDVNSATSQFFIVHGDASFLDGDYTAFGRIVTEESHDALEAIAALETAFADRPVDTEAARVLAAYTVPRSEAAALLELGEPARIGGDAGDGGEETDASLVTPADLEDGVYRNARLGVSFEPPVGWSVQELPTPKPGPEVPDLVVVGPEDDGLPPVISLDVQFVAGRTLEEYIEHRNSFRTAAIESGELVIEDAEDAEINGRAALAQDATGTFPSQGAEREIAFREIVTESEGKFYALTYMAEADEFEGNAGLFEGTLGTFTVPADVNGATAVPRARGDAGAPALFASENHERGFGIVMGLYGGGLDDVGALRAIKYFHSVGAVAFDIGAGDGTGEAPGRPACGPGWPVGSLLAAIAHGGHGDAQKRHCLELLAEGGHLDGAALGF